MSKPELAGGFAVPPTAPVSGQLQDQYLRRVRALAAPTQRLMLLAAADPTGDATLVWRASRTLGIGQQAAAEAASQQLLEIGARVQFRHPLVRSAAYAAGSPQDRRAAHRALAEATDARADPDRRVWHLAAAANGPDEDVAAELERAANRVQARAGLAGAAAFMQRSAALTAAPGRRAERALAAAHGHLHAGAFDTALGLAAEAEAAAGDDLQRARVEQLRGQIDRASNSGREAPVRLLRAAKRLESLDVRLARDTYLDAVFASFVAGRLAESGGHLPEVARAARSAPPPARAPLPRDLLLDGLSSAVIDGQVAAEPLLRRAIEAFLGNQVSTDDWLQGGLLVSGAAIALWDVDCWSVLSGLHLEFARASGALAPLSAALNARRVMAIFYGDFEAATSLGPEEIAVKEATGARKASYGALLLAAYQGRPARRTAHRRERRRRDRSRGGTRTIIRQLGERDSEQRSRPLPGCVARRGASGRRGLHAVHHRLRAPGTGRSGGPKRGVSGRDRCPGQAVDKNGERRRGQRLGGGHLGALARVAQRRRDRRTLLRRSDRATRPYAAAARPRPGTPALRRMAAPPGQAGRRPPPAARGLRPVRGDGRRGLHRARAHRAAGHRREGPQREARRPRRCSPRRSSTSLAWLGSAAPMPKSPGNCSSAPGPSNGTSARSTSNSGSPRGKNSSRRRGIRSTR